jgi:putative transposase
MTAKPVAMLLADLGVTRSHSRPHVSNDNPYSEAQFKTSSTTDLPGAVRLHPGRPSVLPAFFGWYNLEHRHAGIGLLTPADVHYGRAEAVTSAPAVVLDAAYAAHPERFVGKPPQPPDCHRRCGSTSPSTHRRRLSNFPADLSHRG